MNRLDEFYELREELEDTPIELEYSVVRARAKWEQRKKRRKLIIIPATLFSTICMAFIILVNVSPQFASACDGIPLIGQLAKVVAFSDSLSLAVENEYVQKIGMTQSENGITMKIAYAIVDEKDVVLFYSLESNAYDNLWLDTKLLANDNTELEGYTLDLDGSIDEETRLRVMKVEFPDDKVLDHVRFQCKVFDYTGDVETNAEKYLADFTFDVSFDMTLVQQAKQLEVNKDIEMDGQKFTITSANSYPMKLEINMTEDANNTAWLTGLNMYVEDETGRQYTSTGASGSETSQSFLTHKIESPYFLNCKQLSLKIRGVIWREKDAKAIKVDLVNKTASDLPDFVTLLDAVKKGSDWEVTFAVDQNGMQMAQFVGAAYTDEKGREYMVHGWGMTKNVYYDEEKGISVEYPGCSIETIVLQDYKEDVVLLNPSYTGYSKFDKEVEVRLK